MMNILGLHYQGGRDPRPVVDGLVRDAYRKLFQEAGLEVVNMYKLFAREDESYPWVNETRIAPWVIYVLQKTA